MDQNKQRKDPNVPNVVVAFEVAVSRGGRYARIEAFTVGILYTFHKMKFVSELLVSHVFLKIIYRSVSNLAADLSEISATGVTG